MANGMMADGTARTTGPWWADLIRMFGPTAAIAVVLVWMMAAAGSSPMLQQMTGSMQVADTADVRLSEREEQDDAAQRARRWTVIADREKREHQRSRSGARARAADLHQRGREVPTSHRNVRTCGIQAKERD